MNDEYYSEIRELGRSLLSHRYINQQGVIEALPLLVECPTIGEDVFGHLFSTEPKPGYLDGFGSAFITQIFLSINPAAGRTFMEMMEFLYVGNRKEIKDRYDVVCGHPIGSRAIGVLLGVLRVADDIDSPARKYKVSCEEYEKIRDQTPALLAAFINGNVYASNITFVDKDHIFNEELELLLKRGAATYLADKRRQPWMREFCRGVHGMTARNFEGNDLDSKRVYTNLLFGFASSTPSARKQSMLKAAIG